MNDLIVINYENERPTVSGRELHEALGIETPYRIWFPRMCEYGFTEGEDYTPYNFVHPQNKQEITDHQLTIPMAKELCMIQRNDKGRQYRQYFIKIEEMWNSPEMIMKRALEIANARVEKLKSENQLLIADNELMKPKAEYFDELVDRNLLTSFRDTAKELRIKEREFIKYLIEKKYIYRDAKNNLKPYAARSELFEIKEYKSNYSNHSGVQTMVTPKGRETFRLLLKAGK
jgi:anti-repressor protein